MKIIQIYARASTYDDEDTKEFQEDVEAAM